MLTIEAHGLGKYRGGRCVLAGLELSVSPGERLFILGENGCGKSTLLQILTGVLEADLGRVEVRGTVGYAPEKPDLPGHLLVEEWLDLVASLKRLRSPEPVGFGVEDLRRRKVDALSLGQRQRVSLASAWMGHPDVLVLDEPTNGLDEASRSELIAQLQGRTAMVATHDCELAEAASTRILTMKGGRITA